MKIPSIYFQRDSYCLLSEYQKPPNKTYTGRRGFVAISNQKERNYGHRSKYVMLWPVMHLTARAAANPACSDRISTRGYAGRNARNGHGSQWVGDITTRH